MRTTQLVTIVPSLNGTQFKFSSHCRWRMEHVLWLLKVECIVAEGGMLRCCSRKPYLCNPTTALSIYPPTADVLYAYSDPLVAISRRRGPGITVIDGDTFRDLCTLPLDTPVAGLAVDHRDKCFAVVDIQSGCARLFEVRRLCGVLLPEEGNCAV
jgi:hypothetical protein